MTGQQLRNSILQEAIHGRLVPNVLQSGEKTGEELLKDILAERQKKENEEKGKKAKMLTLSTIEEEPWELPEGWCWCKLSDLFSIVSARRVHQSDWRTSGIPFYRTREIGWLAENRTDVKPELYIEESLYERFKQSGYPSPGDIMMTAVGTVGKTYIVQPGDKFYYKDASVLCLENISKVNPNFICHVIASEFFKSMIAEEAMGTTVATITMVRANEYIVPLPPLSIQKAIVEKIEELLPLIDEYDKAAVDLETLNTTLSDKLRKSVLQEAIHGTLVSNNIPEGEATAQELLQKILKERQEKENIEKGKKAKKLTLSIIDDEPWELPEGWCWTQIGDIFDHSAGKSLNSSKQSLGKVYPYLTTSNVYWDGINFEKVKEMAFTEEEYKKCSAIKNDILVCEGGDVGRSCIWPYDYSIGLQNHVHRLRAISSIDVKYFNYVLRFYKCAGIITAKGIGIGGFSANALKGLVVPLPPLSIQHCIVEKIEKVFSAINNLQS